MVSKTFSREVILHSLISGAHQWLTTLCWVEEKIYGLIALGVGFITTILWTTVGIVAAEAADKPQVLLNRNPLGFQRL